MPITNSPVSVSFKNVDIIFGEAKTRALELLDNGGTRESILKETDAVLGVADASIDVHEGEICVLMGLSGSGKSTLLRAVNGLNKVTRGDVLVSNEGGQVNIASCDATTLRNMRMNRIAMVFQQFALLPWRTVEDNVALGLELQGMSREERSPIVDEKLRLVDLYQWKDKYAHELSGGMQQRVGLARAFATDADILLMDEPFSALDPLIRNHLQDFLLDLQQELKKTIIFVSHDLDEALKIGNHIAIMEGGRIVQYGEPEDIVLNPSNEYVADFVAHMNPLNVLQGGSFMTPLADLKRDGMDIILDDYGRFRVTLDQNDKPVATSFDGNIGKIEHCNIDTKIENLGDDVLVTASPDMKMRWNIEVRHQTGWPVLLIEQDRMVGIVGDREIYGGILRQTSFAES